MTFQCPEVLELDDEDNIIEKPCQITTPHGWSDVHKWEDEWDIVVWVIKCRNEHHKPSTITGEVISDGPAPRLSLPGGKEGEG